MKMRKELLVAVMAIVCFATMISEACADDKRVSGEAYGAARFGREVQCDINTDGFTMVNAGILNAHAFIDNEKGIVTISFDCDLKSPDNEGSPDGWHALFRYMVRLFDRNRQYLAHFATEERFAVSGDEKAVNERWGGVHKVIRLKKKNNILRYRINMRDAQYIAIVEFGIYFGL